MRSPTTFKLCAFGLAIVVAGFLNTAALAVDKDFNNPAGGAFSASANWTPSGIPSSADEVFFSLHDPGYNVFFFNAHTNLRARISDDVVTWLLGQPYTLTSTSATSLSIGGSTVIPFPGGPNEGVLTLDGGTVNAMTVRIGDGQFGSGTLNLVDNAVLNTPSGLYVGSSGLGTLHVSLGSDVSSAFGFIGNGNFGSGTATVTGTGSTWTMLDLLTMGINSASTLNITAGGKVTCGTATFGFSAGETATLNTSGASPQSQLICNDEILLGENGAGIMNISGGALVRCSDPSIMGANATATGTVSIDGANSMWDVNASLIVGNQGSGSIAITNGGILDTQGITSIGGSALGDGIVTLTGANSRWDGTSIYVGGNSSAAGGPGTLTINAGTTVDLTYGGLDTLRLWSPGTLNFNGGTLILRTLHLSGGDFNWTSGTLHLTDPDSMLQVGAPIGDILTVSGADKEFHVGGLKIGHTTLGALELFDSAYFQSNGQLSVGGPGGYGALSLASDADMLTFDVVRIGAHGGGQGYATLTGAGTSWVHTTSSPGAEVFVGWEGDGTLDVLDGATVSIEGQAPFTIADFPGTDCTLLIDGTGSSLSVEIQDLTVGVNGLAHITISDGGTLDVPGMLVGQINGSGQISVEGASSSLTTNQSIIGNFGSGTLDVSNGAHASVGNCAVALGQGSDGAITVTGSGAELDALGSMQQLIIGGGGAGELTVLGGGHVSTGQFIAGDGFDATGIVLVSGPGSQLAASEEILVGFNGAGSLSVAGGGIVSSPLIEIAPSSTIGGAGTIAGIVDNSGTIAPGASAGILQVNGLFTQAANGLLAIEIGGLAVGSQYDRLAVSGTVTLNGALDVDLIGGFVPSAGQQFTILTAALVAGQFDTVSLPPGATVTYNSTSVVITIAGAPCPADLNGSGAVNGFDLAILLGDWTGAVSYVPCPPFESSDLNSDCKINGFDLALLLGAWGACGP